MAMLICSACGSATSPTGQTPTSPGAPATSSPAAHVSTSPSTSGCRLPVAALPPDALNPARREVGFVTYPGGALSLDEDGIVYDLSSDRFHTIKQPYLYGQDAEAYDATAHRWVPTTFSLVSPDGSQYAYQAAGALNTATNSYGPSSIHVVQVASGTDRAIYANNAYPVAFEAEGILVVLSTASDRDPTSATETLVLLDPATGSSRQYATSSVRWSGAANGNAFGTDLNPADPNPLIQSPMEPGPSRAMDRAWRLDIATGKAVQWFYRPGRLVEVAGVDSDNRMIVIVVGFDATEAWALTGPESGTKIYSGPGHGHDDPSDHDHHACQGQPCAECGAEDESGPSAGAWSSHRHLRYVREQRSRRRSPVLLLHVRRREHGVRLLRPDPHLRRGVP